MRHKKAQKRRIDSDKLHGNLLVAKFINHVMIAGKKTIAEKNVYGAFELLRAKTLNPIEVFERALQNIAPKVEVRARRVGGANFQVPVEVRAERKTSLAFRWLLEAAKKRSNKEYKTFAEKLASEILAAIKGEGEAIKKRDVAHRMAEANKAFAHFRW